MPGFAVQPEQPRLRTQPHVVAAVGQDADAVGRAAPGEHIVPEISGSDIEQKSALVAGQHPDHAGPRLCEIADGKVVAPFVHPHEIVEFAIVAGESPRRSGVDRPGVVAEKHLHVVVAERSSHPGVVPVVAHRPRLHVAGINTPGEGSHPQASPGDEHRPHVFHLPQERIRTAAERFRDGAPVGTHLQHAPFVNGNPQTAAAVLGETGGERLAPLPDLQRHMFDRFEPAGKVGNAVVLRGDPDSALVVAEKRIDRMGVALAADGHVRHGVDLFRTRIKDEQSVVRTDHQLAARKRQQRTGRHLPAHRPVRGALPRPDHFRKSVGFETPPQFVVAVTKRSDHGGHMSAPLLRIDRQPLFPLAVELRDRAVPGAHEDVPVRAADHVGHGVGQTAVLFERAVLGIIDEKPLGLRADPDFAVAVLEDAGDTPGDDHAVLRAHAERGKQILTLVVQVNALLGPHPQPVFTVGAQRMDRRVQQSVPEVFRIIDAERNPVEAIQAVGRAEPHEPALILGDAPDRIVRQTVVRVITDQRVIPGRNGSGAPDQQKERYDESFHI